MSTVYTGDATAVSNSLARTVSGATNASPIVITTTAAHEFATGDTVVVASVGGNTAANGTWTITKTAADKFSLDGSTGNGAYTSGGTATDVSLTPQFTIPSDGDDLTAASVNVALETLADRTQFLNDELLAETAARVAANGGRLLAVTVLTSASGTFTTSASTNKIKIRGVAGGGAGGGCTSVAAAAGAGGGGGAGGYVEKLFAASPSTGYSYTCGAGGTGVSASPGNAGGDSTFVVGGTTVTTKGGAGGNGCASSGSAQVVYGAAVSAVSTNGDFNGYGAGGHAGLVVSATGPVAIGGAGGQGPFGVGGRALVSTGTGNAASGYGAGGGGAVSGASQATTGGAGTGGVWIVEEYT